MALRNPSNSFPAWTATVGAMLDAGMHVQLSCTRRCSRARPPDLLAIIAAKGRDYSLRNRRFPCRWKPHCPGWIRVYYESGVLRPLWDEPTTQAWIERDRADTELREAIKSDALHRLGRMRERFEDDAIVDPETGLSARNLDALLGRRITVLPPPNAIPDACKFRWQEGDPPPEEPPLGVDKWAWNNAPDDRERRRLIRNARG